MATESEFRGARPFFARPLDFDDPEAMEEFALAFLDAVVAAAEPPDERVEAD